MSLGSFGDDVRLKMTLPQGCWYCGTRQDLSADHLVPRSRGGPDTGENLVRACRSCNSSKQQTDDLEWLANRGEFPPLLLLRRYLKLAIEYCESEGLLDQELEDTQVVPFALGTVPRRFPSPKELVLWRVPLATNGDRLSCRSL